MKKKKQLDLTTGRISRVLIAFILPIILGSLIQQLYTTVDAVIVGRLTGKIGLAAIDSVHTLFRFPINFMNGLAAGATVLISNYFGAKDKQKLYYSIRTVYTVAILLGVIFSIAGVMITPQLLNVMSVPEDIYGETLRYSCIYFGGLWTMVLYNITAGILRALGDSRRPLYVLIFSAVLNIIGDFLMVGIFHLGVQGAAIATVLAQAGSVVLSSRILEEMEEMDGAKRIWKPVFYKEYLWKMLRIGFPLALQSMLFPVANTIVQASVNGMGTDSIAAWGICDKLDLLIWLIADAMSPALTTYTAQNIGAKKLERVKKGAFLGTGMSVCAVGLVSVVLFFQSNTIGRWFVSPTDAGTIIPLVVHYMKMMAPFFIFYAIAEAMSGVCCGMGDTLKPMITTLVTICLSRVIGVLFVLPNDQTMDCIVWIYIVSWIAAGTTFIGMYMLIRKKKLGLANGSVND